MHHISEILPDLLADVLPNSDDMAGCPHLNDLSVVGHAIERGMDRQTAFTEHRLDVERYLHVGGVHVFVLQDDCVKFQKF